MNIYIRYKYTINQWNMWQNIGMREYIFKGNVWHVGILPSWRLGKHGVKKKEERCKRLGAYAGTQALGIGGPGVCVVGPTHIHILDAFSGGENCWGFGSERRRDWQLWGEITSQRLGSSPNRQSIIMFHQKQHLWSLRFSTFCITIYMGLFLTYIMNSITHNREWFHSKGRICGCKKIYNKSKFG